MMHDINSLLKLQEKLTKSKCLPTWLLDQKKDARSQCVTVHICLTNAGPNLRISKKGMTSLLDEEVGNPAGAKDHRNPQTRPLKFEG